MPSLVCSQFSSSVLKQFQTFKENGFLCDVRLVTDSQSEFPAHRLILSAASPFFQDLFRSKRDAQDISTVHLRNCSGDCVQVVLQFLYSGELQLHNCDPTKVLNVAKACKIAPLQYLLAAYDQSDDPKAKKIKLEPKIELDMENYVSSKNAASDKRPESKREIVKKFCQVHSLIGCDCLRSNSNPSSDVFSPFVKVAGSHKRSSEHLTSTPLRGLSNGKSVKNTGVSANLPQSASSNFTDLNGFARNDSDLIQIATDEKEGWCRNKKYIKKTPTGYQCAVCKKTYGRYNSVSYHVTIYHRNPPIQCDQQGCTFSTREARYIHFHKYYRHDIALPTNIDLDSRRCPFCKHVAKSPAMLEKHIKRHLPGEANSAAKGGGSYPCENCDKLLTSKHALMQHSLMHKSQNSHQCDKCSYKGRTSNNLQQHKMFKHGGDLWRKNYQCDQCSYSSPSQFNLVKHKRSLHAKMDEVSFNSDDHCSDGASSLADDDEQNTRHAYNTHSTDPPPPPPSCCSDSELQECRSIVSSTTGFVTAAAECPPPSVIDYGVI